MYSHDTFISWMFRDWSLITRRGGGGGLQNGRGQVKFNTYEKGGGADFFFAMLKRGHERFWGGFYAVALAILMGGGGGGGGGAKSFRPQKGGLQKVSYPRFSHFVARHPRN